MSASFIISISWQFRIYTFERDYAEAITSEPAVDPTHVDWQQEYREKRIADVLQSEDTFLINDSDGGNADDE